MCILQAHNDNKFGLAWVSILLSLCNTLEYLWTLIQVTKLQYKNITYLEEKMLQKRTATDHSQ
jgi:hypothetical protein